MRSAYLRYVAICVFLAAAVAPSGRVAAQIASQSGSAAPSSSQDASASADTFHVHGVVVDSRTGKPISRALVEGYGDRLAALTDHDGRFSLTLRFTAPQGETPRLARQVQNMGAIYLGLSVRKPGYVARTPVMTSTVPLSTLDQDIVLKLTPGSVIEGRVAAAGDDHPESVRISLLSRRAQEGYARWMQVAGTSTNSRGEYRFADLQPGDYRLVTAEWSETPNQPTDFAKPVSRYAPVSYPAGSAEASGPGSHLGIHLGGGEVVPVNLNLHPETFFPVRIPVALPDGSNNGLQVRVQRSGAAVVPGAGFNLRYNAREKLVDGVLPTGSYEVALQTGSQNGTGASATVALAVQGAAVEIAPVTLLPTVSIPVIVHQDYTHAETASSNARGRIQASVSSGALGSGAGALLVALPVQVVLTPAEAVGTSVMLNQRREADTPLALEHVPAGTYRVTIFPLQQGYVAAASSGGTDLLRDMLVVGLSGGAAPIEITLRDDAGTIKGTIDLPDTPGAAAGDTLALYIVAVPSQPSTQRLPQAVVSRSARFTLPNVPPGSYRIFASRQPFETLEYRSEEFMKRNGAKGATVTVGPNGSETVTLTAILDEEP